MKEALLSKASVAWIAVCICFAASAINAQELPIGGNSTETAPVEEVDPMLLVKQGSPQACVKTFLEACRSNDLSTAVNCLDFAELGKATSLSKRETAYQLFQLLSTLWRIEPTVLPEKTEDIEVPLAPALSLTDLEEEEDGESFSLIRGKDGIWKFSPKTVKVTEEIATKYSQQIRIIEEAEEARGENTEKPTPTFALWLEQQVPERYREVNFLIPTYQWACLLVLIFTGFVADIFARLALKAFLLLRFRGYATDEDLNARIKASYRPIGLLALALVWWFGLGLFRLPTLFRTIAITGVQLFAIVVCIWTFFQVIDLVISLLIHNAAKRGKKYDQILLPLFSKTLKTFSVCIGVLIFAESFNLPVVGLLGSLGIGGIAIAFAAKETVSNLFGSLTVMIDRPFEIGDWIITEGVEGSVEQIGLRSTKVRTFHNSLVTLPNSLLITAKVDNMGKRQYRRIRTDLSVQYDTTPEQIEAFCEGIRELIRRHPFTRKDYYQVYFSEFNASSLDIMLYLFLDCNDWSIELRERHRLFIDIIKLAQRLRIQFAFPTQTLHIYQEEASKFPPELQIMDEAGRRAAAEIAGPLPMPNEKRGVVDFPGPHFYDDIDDRRRRRPVKRS